jgi:hypothetical protein
MPMRGSPGVLEALTVAPWVATGITRAEDFEAFAAGGACVVVFGPEAPLESTSQVKF